MSKKITTVLLILTFLVGLLAPMKTIDAAKTTAYTIKVNRKKNVVTVYKKDKKGAYTVPVKAMTCSVGKNNNTPKGTFRIYGKYRWRPLFYGVYGQYAVRFNGSILFHSVTYTKKSPSALQWKEYNKLGSAASHGCVRLTVEDAKWIYQHCAMNTRVIVYDSSHPGPLGKPDIFKISKKVSSKYKGWDPTDPNQRNPWRSIKPTLTVNPQVSVEVNSSPEDVKKDMKATDFMGKELDIKIAGTYDLMVAGTYEITAMATDGYGNTVKKKVVLEVKEPEVPENTEEPEEPEETDIDLST
ncbi:MAG: L,D-transpeptidase [Lachnospiraceae bacterium]|nr:L,D-transpeptidase [Lachnospiraceae bacterium]